MRWYAVITYLSPTRNAVPRTAGETNIPKDSVFFPVKILYHVFSCLSCFQVLLSNKTLNSQIGKMALAYIYNKLNCIDIFLFV